MKLAPPIGLRSRQKLLVSAHEARLPPPGDVVIISPVDVLAVEIANKRTGV